MSLLMKALEQAAKDRGEARNEPSVPPPTAASPKPELSLALELLAAEDPAPQPRPEAAPRPRPATTETGEAATREQSRAATVMRAGERASGGTGERRRMNPVIVFGAVAGLFAVGFALYVYLQIYHPAFFARRPPAQPPVSPIAQPPPPATAAPPGIPPTAAAPVTDAPAVTPPIPSSAVLPPPAAESRAPVAPVAPAPPARPAAPAPQPPGPPGARIVVSGGTPAATVSPQLVEAYGALQSGNIETAQRLYAQQARTEPKNIDALLGLAATAALQGRADDATRHYQQILELDPRHALAQSGLIGLYGRGDPLSAETRLKQLIAREPSPFLYFTLGNLYADQSLWAQAQQAYFQAHHLEPGNPDYAYNLAVGLEHLSQPRLALGFYRQAAALAAKRGHANFNAAQVQERISRLAAQVE
jgi:Flp pilus assembly protein TadD